MSRKEVPTMYNGWEEKMVRIPFKDKIPEWFYKISRFHFHQYGSNLFFLNCDWSIVDRQYDVSFRWTAQRFSYIYISISLSIYIHIYILFQIIFPYRSSTTLSTDPCAIRQVLVGSPLGFDVTDVTFLLLHLISPPPYVPLVLKCQCFIF